MTSREAYLKTRARLLSITEEAALEARLLLARVTGMEPSRAALSEEPLSPEAEEALEELIKRRLRREPIQYLLGEWGFMGLPFFVSPAALIPRQDTELLCEEALRLIAERGYKSALDICTGTGCIAVSIERLSKTPVIMEASDISAEALALAERNAERNSAQVLFRRADLFGGAGEYDLVTANPPYISEEDMKSLEPELSYEPRLALFGGEDGLALYRRIAREAETHIRRGGVLLLEVGAGEAEAVRGLFPERETAVIKDLNGVERVVRIDF